MEDSRIETKPGVTTSVSELGRAAVSGTSWLTLARWIVRGSSVITVVILARLLDPTEYGLVAIAMTLSNVLWIGNFGLQAALVQRKAEVSDDDLDVGWTYDKLLSNSVIAAGMVLGAPWIAGIFDAAELTPIVRALAAIPLLQIIENNAMVVLTRSLDYRRRFVLEAAVGVGMVVTVVPLAFLWSSVWAYVVGYLVATAARSAMSYVIYPVLPRPNFDVRVLKSLFVFGRWMIGLRILQGWKDQLDKLLLGGLLGPTQLGYFHVGGRMPGFLVADANQTALKVFFPIYARLQSDVPRLARGYVKVLEITLAFVLPVATTLAILAEPILVLLFGNQWQPAVPVVRLFAAASVARVLVGTIHPLVRGYGRPAWEFWQNVLYILMLVPLLVVLARAEGFVGAALAVLIVDLLQLPFWVWVLGRLNQPIWGLILRKFAYLTVLTMVIGAIEWMTLGILEGRHSGLQILASGATGGAAYVCGLWLGGRVVNLVGLRTLMDTWTTMRSSRRARIEENG